MMCFINIAFKFYDQKCIFSNFKTHIKVNTIG